MKKETTSIQNFEFQGWFLESFEKVTTTKRWLDWFLTEYWVLLPLPIVGMIKIKQPQWHLIWTSQFNHVWPPSIPESVHTVSYFKWSNELSRVLITSGLCGAKAEVITACLCLNNCIIVEYYCGNIHLSWSVVLASEMWELLWLLGPHMMDVFYQPWLRISRCSTENELDIGQFHILVHIQVIGNDLKNTEKLIGR